MAMAAPAWRSGRLQGRIARRRVSDVLSLSGLSGQRLRQRLRRGLAVLVAFAVPLALPLASAVAIALAGVSLAAAPARADAPPARRAYRCAGDPLQADLYPGAVDAPAIANSSAGTLPGAFVVLQWRDLSLQLPRTNNAGPPSFTDGRWWWSLEDADHPRFRLRQGRGDVQEFACEPLLQAGG